MADDFVTFDNKILNLLNPLPNVTFEELHKRANVTLRKRKMAQRHVFPLDLRWGGGEDFKSHTLLPGKSIRMPEKVGREIAQDFRPVGSLCATNPGLACFENDSERTQAMIEALMIAETHYNTLGAEQIDGVRTARGHRDDEVERFKDSTYATYLLAQAKADLIREQREKLEQKAAQGK